MKNVTGLTLENGWTVERVAEELGVKTRTVHHHVTVGNLHPQKYLRPGVGGGAINLFSPVEVTRFLRQRIDDKTKVVPANDPGPRISQRSVERPSTDIVKFPEVERPSVDIVKFLEHIAGCSQAVLPVDRKRYLTLEEAVAYTGLGAFYIEENCESWPIGPHTKRVFRRADLDKL